MIKMPKGVYERTTEHNKKLSEALKGRIINEEWRKKISESKKGIVSWNKGIVMTEEQKKNMGKYIRTDEIKKKISESKKGIKLSKEHKQKISETLKGKKPWNTGKHLSEEHRKKISESLKGNKHLLGKNFSDESKQRMCEAQKKRYEDPKEREKTSDASKMVWENPDLRKKQSEIQKKRYEDIEERKKTGELVKIALSNEEVREKMSVSQKKRFEDIKEREKISKGNKGKIRTEESKKKYSESKKGVKNPNWNPNREEVYFPYGEKFYDDEIRENKWNLQNGRDMLTGTILDFNKKPAYHHIDYDKSNDNPDNLCFVSMSNHGRITGNQRNTIKSEEYKKILHENTFALKNGEIPKSWSPLNKELFRQEKLKQLDLSSYII